jgi:hypothetical protein
MLAVLAGAKSMDRSEVTPTLLNAILSNQAAIIGAIGELAAWAEAQGSTPVASAVREHLDKVQNNQAVIGSCISSLMQPR